MEMSGTTEIMLNREFFKSHLMAILSEANLHQLDEWQTLKLIDTKSADEAEQMTLNYNQQFDLRIKSREGTYIK